MRRMATGCRTGLSAAALAAWLALWTGGTRAAPPEEPPNASASVLDGDKEAEGGATALSGGVWSLGEHRLAESRILSLYFGARDRISLRAEVVFANGDRLRGKLESHKAEAGPPPRDLLVFSLEGGGEAKVDLSAIQSILLWDQLAGLGAEAKRMVLEQTIPAEGVSQQKDLMFLLKGGQLDREDHDFVDPKHLAAGSVEREIPDPEDISRTKLIRAPILAVRFKFPAEVVPPKGPLWAVLWAADGTRLTGKPESLAEGKLSFQTVHGFSLKIPLDRVRQIDYAQAGWRHLSDLPDPTVSARRFLDAGDPDDRLWPHFAKDRPIAPGRASELPLSVRGRLFRKGLGMHAYAKAAFTLPAGFKRFLAEVGIDDHVAEEAMPQAAGAVVRVYGDGKLLHQSALLTVQSPPERISVAVEGVRTLELEVDWQDRLAEVLAKNPPVPPEELWPQTDMLDRVSWGHCVLVR